MGLGNALRFPGLCAKYGGGAFLLVYFIALVVLGLPLLNAEIAMGRKFKSGAPRCLAGMSGRQTASAVGWAAGLNSAITAVIYAGLAGWIIATAANITPLCINSADLTRAEISGYFFDNVLKSRPDGVIDGISPVVLVCIAAAWVLMYFCLKGGAGSLVKAAKFTVIIPISILLMLACRGLMYDNSGEALAALFIPDFSCLSRADMWLTALGQVFFSLSVAVGIMPVYGSYLPEGEGIFGCSLAVAAADFLVSVLASVVLFTTLYGCGIQGAICDSGILTAFAVYPVAITSLFGDNAVLNSIAGILFYSSLAMMAVQSAVSMLEAFISPFSDGNVKKKKRAVGCACLAGAAAGALFATSAAPLIVEVADLYVNFYNVLVLCIAECLILAFSKKTEELLYGVNEFSKRLKMPKVPFLISVKFLSPAILVCLGAVEVCRVISAPPSFPLWVIIAFGAGLSLCVCALSVILCKRRKLII